MLKSLLIKIQIIRYFIEKLCPKGADGMANSVDPDQTTLEEQSDLGLHCLPRPVCAKP